MSQWSRAVVVGASSGIGEAIARQLAASGTNVVLVARRRELLESVAGEINSSRDQPLAEVVICDVRDVTASRGAFADVVESGPIDLIVYSSGIMPAAGRQGYDTDAHVDTVDTNFRGAVVWLNAAAEHFLEQGHGTIVGIGSVAGERGRAVHPVYGATKAAMKSYFDSLSARLSHKGIRVLIAKPGPVKTAMMGDRKVFPDPPTADEAARSILSAASRGRRVVYVPAWMIFVSLALRLMPRRVLERVSV